MRIILGLMLILLTIDLSWAVMVAPGVELISVKRELTGDAIEGSITETKSFF